MPPATDATVMFRPTPEAIAASLLTDFLRHCGVADDSALQTFALAEPARFWTLLLEWSGLPFEGATAPAIAGAVVETARFFPEVRLSYARALLFPAGVAAEAVAITSVTEAGTTHLTWAALRERVARGAGGLQRLGVAPGDRVVAVVRNVADAIVACLATAAVGAIWSSTAPDLAPDAILQRFGQLEPRWLIAHGSTTYQGRDVPVDVASIVRGLPTLAGVIALDDAAAACASHEWSAIGEGPPLAEWPTWPFNHPLFILFSSGTTGAPKCIVHGAGGTLLEHVKEHRLHTDLRPGDALLYSTTAGWMMWNWLVSALASGVRVVLYDGSVAHPADDALLQVVARERVTHFGTSPVYLQYLRDAGISPRERVDLSALRALLSTGSILYPQQYDQVAEHFGALPLQSISGGTDIVGCFVLGNPNRPVHRGESQSVSFGYDVRVKLMDGSSPDGTARQGSGELVCCAPFPSRPIGLWNDPDGRRFHAAYFAENEGLWTHGDFLELTPRGGARILGRSDGVMNIRGVRIGPAEIYAALQDFAEYAALMALAQPDPRAAGGTRLVLLAVMRPGADLDRGLVLRTKKALKTRCSAYHVPEVVAAVSDLPTTQSGKRSERAAQDVLDGRPVRNAHALRNPAILEEIRAHPALRLPA